MHMLLDAPIRQLRDEILQMYVSVTHGERAMNKMCKFLFFLLVNVIYCINRPVSHNINRRLLIKTKSVIRECALLIHDSRRIVRIPDFAYAKTKAQISFAVTAKLISAFVFATWIKFLFFLNPKFQVCSLF